jgi:N-acetylmuramoyl-L-alanine amidase CwlA
MINVRQNLVSPAKHDLKCPFKMEAEYITFHNTYNDATASSEVKYMISNNNSVSFHYAVDDKEVVQGILTSRNAWHCGDGRGKGNMKSIGVEVCYSKSGGKKYDDAEELGIQFIAQLLFERKWKVDRVKPHRDWSGKNCPHRILDSNRWQSVLNRINKALQELNEPVKTASDKPIENKTKDGVRMFNPSKAVLTREMIEFLIKAKADGVFSSDEWKEKALKGELPLDDVLGLIATYLNRTHK